MRNSRAQTLLIAMAAIAAGCGGAAATLAPSAATPTEAALATSTPRPTRTPTPTSPFTAVQDTVEAPTGWSITRTANIGFGLATEDVLLGSNYDLGVVYRYDRETYRDLGTIQLGTRGAFPPDGQSLAAGSGGVWVTIASQRAVGLMDPASGEIIRRVEVDGYPYDIVEDGRDLWIADFEGGTVTRYDLRRNEVVATIAVNRPTDVIVAEGAVWLPIHVGRREEHQPIEGNGAQIARIDPAANTVAALIPVGPRPYFMAGGFGSLWTGAATGEAVWRVDAATNTPTKIPVPEDGVFDIEAVGDSVWAVAGPQYPESRRCDPDHSWFVRVDPTTNAVREFIAFPCPGSITPDGDGFWVSGGAPGVTYSAYYEPAT